MGKRWQGRTRVTTTKLEDKTAKSIKEGTARQAGRVDTKAFILYNANEQIHVGLKLNAGLQICLGSELRCAYSPEPRIVQYKIRKDTRKLKQRKW